MTVGALVILFAGVALVIALVIPGGEETPNAAATVLAHVGHVVADQPVLQPGPGQFVETTYKVSIVQAELKPDGSVRSTAGFNGTVQEWVSNDGSGHAQISYGPPQFPTVADQHSWQPSVGFPLQGDEPFSSSGPLVQLGPEIGAFNVSRLPTDPSKLARVLGGGIKGVPGLNGGTSQHALVFDQVMLLLSTPQVGGSAALESALYEVLSTQPGVESLGTMTDHLGRHGIGFTEPGSALTLIVDPATGHLLELRNANHPLSGGGGAMVGTSSLRWEDPVGSRLTTSAANSAK